MASSLGILLDAIASKKTPRKVKRKWVHHSEQEYEGGYIHNESHLNEEIVLTQEELKILEKERLELHLEFYKDESKTKLRMFYAVMVCLLQLIPPPKKKLIKLPKKEKLPAILKKIPSMFDSDFYKTA